LEHRRVDVEVCPATLAVTVAVSVAPNRSQINMPTLNLVVSEVIVEPDPRCAQPSGAADIVNRCLLHSTDA